MPRWEQSLVREYVDTNSAVRYIYGKGYTFYLSETLSSFVVCIKNRVHNNLQSFPTYTFDALLFFCLYFRSLSIFF